MNSIHSAIQSGHGKAILYAGAIGLILSDVIPTPADALYFSLAQKNKVKLEKKEITPRQYWLRDVAMYYGLNPVYWAGIFGIMVLVKGDFAKKAKVGLALVAAGAVVSVINSNIKKDESLLLSGKI